VQGISNMGCSYPFHMHRGHVPLCTLRVKGRIFPASASYIHSICTRRHTDQCCMDTGVKCEVSACPNVCEKKDFKVGYKDGLCVLLAPYLKG